MTKTLLYFFLVFLLLSSSVMIQRAQAAPVPLQNTIVSETAILSTGDGQLSLPGSKESGEKQSKNTVIHRSHGLSRFDDLKYPADFRHYDYANPDAPKGGALSLYAQGTFDSLNPYSIQGISPVQVPSYSYMRYGFSELNEPLMVGTGSYSPSGDESKSAYGLIARSVEFADDNRWITFFLRPEARFHDGHPVTANDVVFSFNTLKEQGHPRYKMQLDVVERVEKLGTHSVRFHFTQAGHRSQLFRVAELPVLPEHFWQQKDISKSTLKPLLNSGPYRITDVQQGVSITFTRVKDYWGKDLPVNKGRYNFDRITLYFHRDAQVAFESFKAGGHDLHLEIIAKNWNTAYDFPAVKEGRVKRTVFKHQMPYGSSFLFFNTRRWPFDDIRVRQAISLLFDFEWTNRAIFFNAYKRSDSYFANSTMAARGLPHPSEVATLDQWKKSLPEAVFTKRFAPPETMGNGNIRQQQKQALALLQSAGWVLEGKTLIHMKTKQPLRFAFLSKSSATERYILPFRKNLETVGIDMNYAQVDAAQYYRRLRGRDYDMIEQILPQTLSPDVDLMEYFYSDETTVDGARNFAGIHHPAINGLVERVPKAQTEEELKTLVHSLDRVLLRQYYGIPKWYSDFMRAAYRDVFAWPDQAPLYTTPFSTWWRKEGK